MDASGSTARRHNTSVDTAESVFCLDHGWSLQGAAARSRKATASTSAIQTPHASLRGQSPLHRQRPPPAISCLGASRTPAAAARGCRRHAGVRETCTNNRLGPHRTNVLKKSGNEPSGMARRARRAGAHECSGRLQRGQWNQLCQLPEVLDRGGQEELISRA